MKKLLLVTLAGLFIGSNSIMAEGWCGTKYTEQQLEKIKNDIAASKNISRKSGTIYYVPIQPHFVGDDNGSGFFKFSDFLTSLCELNEQYVPVGFHFYLYDDVKYIKNTSYSKGDNGTTMMYQNNVNKVANVYFVPEQPGLCGYYSYQGDAVVISNSCGMPSGTTIAHELGHYFGLPHTFSPWDGYDPEGTDYPWKYEYVDGSNCDNAGDYFCDTPADFIGDRWNCPYNYDRIDEHGDAYYPDSSLFMSYANDDCTNRFSNEQIGSMIYNIIYYRDDLLDHPIPDVKNLYETEHIYPKDLQGDIPANYALMTWKPVEGATSYNILVTRFLSASSFNVNDITSNNWYIATNLQSGFKYRWKVRPYFNNNTCTDFTTITSFYTETGVELSPDISIGNVSDCKNASDGFISINTVNGGTAPYSYKWSSGATTAAINNLLAGVYAVTITDSDSIPNISILEYAVSEPLIGIEFDTTIASSPTAFDGSATVITLGATDPITYIWSDGQFTSKLSNVTAGDYVVTVTDTRGCTSSGSIEVTAMPADTNTGVIVFDKNSPFLKMYPNPVKSKNNLIIELNDAFETSSISIDLFSFQGQKINTSHFVIQQESRIVTINIESVPSGIYLVRLQNGNLQYLQKLSIIR